MNMKLIGVVVVVLLVVVGGMYFMKVPPFAPATSEAPFVEAGPDNAPDAMMEDEAMMEKDGDAMMEGDAMMAADVVDIVDFAFNPPNLTVKAGTTVTFVNKDSVGHSATADDGSFDTGVMNQDESGTVTFDTPGTYTYHCTPHPNMTGTVVVE